MVKISERDLKACEMEAGTILIFVKLIRGRSEGLHVLILRISVPESDVEVAEVRQNTLRDDA